MNTDSLKHFVRSRFFVGILVGVGAVLIVLCIFEVGVTVGYHEAQFTSHYGENYQRNFGDDTAGSFGMPDGRGPNSHGVQGTIVSVSPTMIMISDTQQPEQKVLIDSSTIIRNQSGTIPASSLSNGEYAVVIGTPDDQGEIDAKLIRVLPAPASNPNDSPMTSSTTP